MNQITDFLATIGEEVIDVDEESFLLFAQDIPTNNLGMLDARAPSVEVTINGNDYTIHQSPSLLSSHRAGGTTGAVLWKITPIFAEWISSPSNPLWTHTLLTHTSTVAELGTGISALVALSLAPSVQHYIATDQEYVRKLFRTNLDANVSTTTSKSKSKSKGSKPKSKVSASATPSAINNVSFTTLDWETDQAASLKECIDADGAEDEEDRGFDLLLSCDCVYNEALVAPFVRTCAEICRLRPVYVDGAQEGRRPTVCIIAQQQRSPDVFEAWLREAMREFRVWRVSDEVLGKGLGGGSGYLVHLLLAKE
ncbi:uncharacterized protein N7515_002665 [Penicillium bovifimosum]|uniref:Diaminohydroxyphosphoribosylamino-pyrimidine deaminase n=1 Tax=Penicillium bovifimosum TaxID=126998 RepID=A0A9W9HC16_9EURO|nr:uncharacterized protein N7515_002665 [Penicillium bovifimosum]KAJ5143878.1 hypothetical protein N7515_002665 [Penicillium bovifimosum]